MWSEFLRRPKVLRQEYCDDILFAATPDVFITSIGAQLEVNPLRSLLHFPNYPLPLPTSTVTLLPGSRSCQSFFTLRQKKTITGDRSYILMSTTSSATCQPPKHAGFESLAYSDPSISGKPPTTQLPSTPTQSCHQSVEPRSELPQILPPLPPSSSSPRPPSTDPASASGLDSSILTNIAPPEGSASINSQEGYSTPPTDVGSASSQKSTLRPARASLPAVRPRRHVHEPIQVIRLAKDPGQSPTVFFEVNGVRVQEEGPSSSPVQSPPTPVPPETSSVNTQDSGFGYPPLPSPFPPQLSTVIAATQASHSHSPLRAVLEEPLHAPAPTSTVPRQRPTVIHASSTPRGLRPQRGTQETTTPKQTAAVTPRDPTRRHQPPRSARGGVAAVPRSQLNKPAPSEPAQSHTEPPAAAEHPTPQKKALIRDFAYDVDKPLPPPPRLLHRLAPWLFR